MYNCRRNESNRASDFRERLFVLHFVVRLKNSDTARMKNSANQNWTFCKKTEIGLEMPISLCLLKGGFGLLCTAWWLGCRWRERWSWWSNRLQCPAWPSIGRTCGLGPCSPSFKVDNGEEREPGAGFRRDMVNEFKRGGELAVDL